MADAPKLIDADGWHRMADELRVAVAEVPDMQDHPIFALLALLAEDSMGGPT